MKHIRPILLLICILISNLSFSQIPFDYCTNSFPDISPGTSQYDPVELCVSLSSWNLQPATNAGIVMDDIPFEWFLNDNQPDEWFYTPNDYITIDISFQFGGQSTDGNSYPVDRNITIEYRGTSETILLSWDQANHRFYGSHTISSLGEPIFDEPQGHALLINFWDNGGEASDNLKLSAAARLMIQGASKLISDPLWVASSPQAPQLILRDPPGDGSYSSFTTANEVCHGFGMSTSNLAEGSVFATAKLGVSASTGVIVETEVEAYVEISAELTAGFTDLTLSDQKMCFKTENIYSTSDDNPGLTAGSGDIYIGASVQYVYGLYKRLYHNGTQLDTLKQLAFGLSGSVDQFVYPESYIVNTLIPESIEAISNLEPGTNEYLIAADQLEVWEQYVAMNAAIKADAIINQTNPAGLNFTAGTNFTASKSTTSSQMRSIEMNMYIDVSLGLEIGAEVAGTGGSLGAKIRTRVDRGSSVSSSNSHTSTISYSFSDDDAESSENLDEDVFHVELYDDPVFGTPIFVLDSLASRSSCPYEGGYQMHNPNLVYDDNTTHKVIMDIPVGESATFEIDICNESDYPREYFIKVPLESNLSGLEVSMGGSPITVINGTTSNIIPANTCLQNAVVTIQQPNGSSIVDFEEVQIIMFTECQPSFAPTTSIATFDAHFSTVDGLKELDERNDLMTIFPNPNKGQFSVKAEKLTEVSTLQVRDLTSRLVYQSQVKPSSQAFSIDLGGVSKGIYLLTVFNTQERMTQKVIID